MWIKLNTYLIHPMLPLETSLITFAPFFLNTNLICCSITKDHNHDSFDAVSSTIPKNGNERNRAEVHRFQFHVRRPELRVWSFSLIDMFLSPSLSYTHTNRALAFSRHPYDNERRIVLYIKHKACPPLPCLHTRYEKTLPHHMSSWLSTTSGSPS